MTPTRNQRRLGLAGIIGALGLWLAYSQLGTAPQAAIAVDSAAADPEVPAEAVSGRPTPLLPAQIERRKQIAEATWPADPFRLARAAPGSTPTIAGEPAISGRPQFVLSAILQGDPPMAIINGRILTVGQHISDDVWLGSVSELSVSLEGSGGGSTLYLSK